LGNQGIHHLACCRKRAAIFLRLEELIIFTDVGLGYAALLASEGNSRFDAKTSRKPIAIAPESYRSATAETVRTIHQEKNLDASPNGNALRRATLAQ
jgi:hypothetical protein